MDKEELVFTTIEGLIRYLGEVSIPWMITD